MATKVIGIDISQGMVDVVGPRRCFSFWELFALTTVISQYNKKVKEQLENGPEMQAVLLPQDVEQLTSIIGKDVDCAFVGSRASLRFLSILIDLFHARRVAWSSTMFPTPPKSSRPLRHHSEGAARSSSST